MNKNYVEIVMKIIIRITYTDSLFAIIIKINRFFPSNNMKLCAYDYVIIKHTVRFIN
jgi:hypothetical protein